MFNAELFARSFNDVVNLVKQCKSQKKLTALLHVEVHDRVALVSHGSLELSRSSGRTHASRGSCACRYGAGLLVATRSSAMSLLLVRSLELAAAVATILLRFFASKATHDAIILLSKVKIELAIPNTRKSRSNFNESFASLC